MSLIEILYRPLHRRNLQMQVVREHIELLAGHKMQHCGIHDTQAKLVYHFEMGGWRAETYHEFMTRNKFGIDDTDVEVKKHNLSIEDQERILRQLRELVKYTQQYCPVTNNCETQLNMLVYGRRESNQIMTYFRSVCDYILTYI